MSLGCLCGCFVSLRCGREWLSRVLSLAGFENSFGRCFAGMSLNHVSESFGAVPSEFVFGMCFGTCVSVAGRICLAGVFWGKMVVVVSWALGGGVLRNFLADRFKGFRVLCSRCRGGVFGNAFACRNLSLTYYTSFGERLKSDELIAL